MTTASEKKNLKPVAPTSLFKDYQPGEVVNLVRGEFRGTSATVKQMDEVTGKVTLISDNGTEFTVSHGLLNRPRENKEPNPVITAEEVKTGEQVIAKRTEVKRSVCPCGCGILANKGREFRSGHDQTHKGNLIRAMQEGSAEAEAELRKRKWRTNAEITELKGKKGKTRITSEMEAELKALVG